jgi:hypothetical protein
MLALINKFIDILNGVIAAKADADLTSLRDPKQRVESLLIEGLDSGESVEVIDDWWNSKRDAIEMLILKS